MAKKIIVTKPRSLTIEAVHAEAFALTVQSHHIATATRVAKQRKHRLSEWVRINFVGPWSSDNVYHNPALALRAVCVACWKCVEVGPDIYLNGHIAINIGGSLLDSAKDCEVLWAELPQQPLVVLDVKKNAKGAKKT